MSKAFVFVLGLFALNTVGAEEESPVSISQSPDIEDRTAIHEDLKPNENSRTINIKIINSDALEQAIGKSETVNDDNVKRSADTAKSLEDDTERAGSMVDFGDDIAESKVGAIRETQDRSEMQDNNENDSRNHLEAATGRVAKSSDDNTALSFPEEASRNDRPLAGNSALEFIESEGKSMMQDVMLETKGRAAEQLTSLEAVKALSDEDFRNFKSLKPMDSPVLHRRFGDGIIPNYYKALSRNAFPHNLSMHSFQNTRPPYFGRLTNPIRPQYKGFENSFIENTRRSDNPTESDQELKLLEEYTDPDSNAYPYVPITGQPLQRVAPSRNEPSVHQKIMDATNLKYLTQINSYSSEISPPQYAPNYPYGLNALTRFR